MGTTGRRKSGESKQGRKKAKRPGFDPRDLDRTVIAIPLLELLKGSRTPIDIIIDLNLDFDGGVKHARADVEAMIGDVLRDLKKDPRRQGTVDEPDDGTQYVFATLDRDAIRELVQRDRQRAKEKSKRAIYHVWPDFEVNALIYKSISTVKADAAHNAFAAHGADIVWAVVDSGIDGTHPHFLVHDTLELPPPLQHRDFTSAHGDARVDAHGHGTHVAGIIAGGMTKEHGAINATTVERDQRGNEVEISTSLSAISGMAPRCKLLSLKVLDDDGNGNGTGKSSAIIRALQYVQQLNEHGRRLRVHGVNLSVGYPFDAKWFACGQSPLCVEVNRLVKSGVVVVVAAGNAGYGALQTEDVGLVRAGMVLTIEDPGNAELAITVGSTHRDMPHTYGVSYFSSKGPTGDGRLKPDLLAPGEKIVSCTSSGVTPPSGKRAAKRPARAKGVGNYGEGSGTSMAAPHVSGAIAAFLSIRREFIQQPEEVKRIFVSAATDLKRVSYFQGHGLVDLMRAIQSV